MSDDVCRTCRWWERDKGECRRYPPALVVVTGEPEMAGFPPTRPFDWCGEWEARLIPQGDVRVRWDEGVAVLPRAGARRSGGRGDEAGPA